jgi:hypothetical protein
MMCNVLYNELICIYFAGKLRSDPNCILDKSFMANCSASCVVNTHPG